jgi:ATP-binding cassette subfamily B protein
MGASLNSADAGPSNSELIRRLFRLAWRYRLRCVQVLGVQLVLLTMGLFGLSFTGIGIDYILRVVRRGTRHDAPHGRFTSCT